MAYTFEEEQEIAQLKEWWQKNYKQLIAVSLIAITGAIGWNVWVSQQTAEAQASSNAFNNLINDPNTQDLDKFIQTNPQNTYTDFALWQKAKLEVDNGKYKQAETTLTQALKEAKDEQFKIISTLRLAMVQLQLQKYDTALKTLTTINNQAWMSQKLQLEGDIYLAKQDSKMAKEKYQQALAIATPTEKNIIQIKINNI